MLRSEALHGVQTHEPLMKSLMNLTYKVARRIVVAVVGTTVLLLGVIMLVTPGPAFILIPTGLAILGIEFAWARYWLRKARKTISSQTAKMRGNNAEEHRQSEAQKERNRGS